MEIIDAHHHFLAPTRRHYPWLDAKAMAPVRRSFGPQDLAPLLAANGVSGTVLVQTISSIEETQEFLALAAAPGNVLGVVGWADVAAEDIGDQIDALRASPGGHKLVGIRHQVEDEPDPEWLCRPPVRRGLHAIAQRGLVFDLLVRARELPAAISTASAMPDLQFALDHLAKPPIASADDGAWGHYVRELATLPNVAAKVSGLVTEADWRTWAPGDLAPYIARAMEWFGIGRLMWGSDWPVCLLAATYAEWLTVASDAFADLTPAEQQALFSANATQVYNLSL
jgi:L-fuconolactonase